MALEDHVEILLDEALEATFPASDPLALAIVAERWRADGQQPVTKESLAREGSDDRGQIPAVGALVRLRTVSEPA